MSKRQVYFYETYVVDDRTGKSRRVQSNFWPKLRARIGAQLEADRTVRVQGVGYVGELRSISTPACGYIYLGRLRTQDEWPDGYRRGAGFSDLAPVNADSLGEPAYLVDIIGSSRVAVMGRSGWAPRPSATEIWLATVAGLSATRKSIELRPIINPNFIRDLEASVGAKKLRLTVDKAKAIPEDGGGRLADAFRSAQDVSSEMSVTVEWSVGRAKPSDMALESLGSSLKWAVAHEVPDNGSVSLVLENEDGDRRVAHYDLVKQRMTEQADIPDGVEGERVSEASVISAIQTAVERLQQRLR